MIYQAISYSKFLRKSKNQHGVHSPFVFNFLTNCVYDKSKRTNYTTLKEFRRELKNSKEEIAVTDFGAGSRIFKGHKRKVSAIAKHAGMRKKRQRLLLRICEYFQPTSVLELGTSVGLATVAMSLGSPFSKIATIEGCEETALVAAKFFQKYFLTNISLHQESFEDYFRKNSEEKFDLVFIDGNHDKENTLAYFNQFLFQKKNDSLFIFDDIYWSKQMTAAWQEIKAHPEVTVSIDTYQWGLVFFRREQEKEHFTIRV